MNHHAVSNSPVPNHPVPITIDADHRLRGPYTVGGTLVRAIAGDLLAHFPDLAQRHDIELLAMAPELADRLDRRRTSLMLDAKPGERTRFYPAAYTARLANGVIDVLLDYLGRTDGGPWHVAVHNTDRADPTDTELLALLARRGDPGLLRLTTRSGGPASMDAALDPAEHDRLAAELLARGEFSWELGAVPFHLERGTDPSGAGAAANERALDHCMSLGYYHAVLRFGARVHTLSDWDTDPDRCWLATVKMCTALGALDRPAEAEALYDEACRSTTSPSVHMQSAYGKAMLYTRFYGADRNHERALGLINTAVAIASLGTDQQRRAYNVSFQENGKALVAMHRGDLDTALRLIEQGLRLLGEQVTPGRFDPHRSVLHYNRAQLLARMGATEQAIAGYDTVLAMDPNHPEYHAERAALHQRAGRPAAALADYADAIRLGPPCPEMHYNRAALLQEIGDYRGAADDYGRAVQLDDQLADGYVNGANCLLDLDDVDGAAHTVSAGLARFPAHADLLCLRGMVEQRRGRVASARAAFLAALRHDPTMFAAWANLGVLSYESGDAEAAVEYFDRALALSDDAGVRDYRATASAGLVRVGGGDDQ